MDKRGRAKESREAAAQLRDLLDTPYPSKPQRRALELAISILDARALDADED